MEVRDMILSFMVLLLFIMVLQGITDNYNQKRISNSIDRINQTLKDN